MSTRCKTSFQKTKNCIFSLGFQKQRHWNLAKLAIWPRNHTQSFPCQNQKKECWKRFQGGLQIKMGSIQVWPTKRNIRRQPEKLKKDRQTGIWDKSKQVCLSIHPWQISNTNTTRNRHSRENECLSRRNKRLHTAQFSILTVDTEPRATSVHSNVSWNWQTNQKRTARLTIQRFMPTQFPESHCNQKFHKLAECRTTKGQYASLTHPDNKDRRPKRKQSTTEF